MKPDQKVKRRAKNDTFGRTSKSSASGRKTKRWPNRTGKQKHNQKERALLKNSGESLSQLPERLPEPQATDTLSTVIEKETRRRQDVVANTKKLIGDEGSEFQKAKARVDALLPRTSEEYQKKLDEQLSELNRLSKEGDPGEFDSVADETKNLLRESIEALSKAADERERYNQWKKKFDEQEAQREARLKKAKENVSKNKERQAKIRQDWEAAQQKVQEAEREAQREKDEDDAKQKNILNEGLDSILGLANNLKLHKLSDIDTRAAEIRKALDESNLEVARGALEKLDELIMELQKMESRLAAIEAEAATLPIEGRYAARGKNFKTSIPNYKEALTTSSIGDLSEELKKMEETLEKYRANSPKTQETDEQKTKRLFLEAKTALEGQESAAWKRMNNPHTGAYLDEKKKIKNASLLSIDILDKQMVKHLNLSKIKGLTLNGRYYVKGSSDTAGVSLKTPLPPHLKGGGNSREKERKSFIIHL